MDQALPQDTHPAIWPAGLTRVPYWVYRDQELVQERLGEVREAARGTANVLPALRQALKDRCSIGEVSGALRDVFGAYRPSG